MCVCVLMVKTKDIWHYDKVLWRKDYDSDKFTEEGDEEEMEKEKGEKKRRKDPAKWVEARAGVQGRADPLPCACLRLLSPPTPPPTTTTNKGWGEGGVSMIL